MKKIRTVKEILKSYKVVDGAGVHINRVFGYNEIPKFDPFLLLDDFRNDLPENYRKGFPWHPHRGIETITYMLEGSVEHKDSIGNKGVLNAGDVQWMTAGSGIIHQEMPKGNDEGKMYGFQLWANLPASHKMIAPVYQEFKSSLIPEITMYNGTKIKMICGQINDLKGPVKEIVINPEFLDITVPQNSEYIHQTKVGHNVFAYVIGGACQFESEEQTLYENKTLALFDDGEYISIKTKETGVRFLLISGKPIKETVAWGGPIVMNTDEELNLAFEEIENGNFIKNQST